MNAKTLFSVLEEDFENVPSENPRMNTTMITWYIEGLWCQDKIHGIFFIHETMKIFQIIDILNENVFHTHVY